MHRTTKILFAILFSLLILNPGRSFVYAADAKPIYPQLQFNIPGFSADEIKKGYQEVTEGNRKVTYINWLAVYLGSIYQFAMYLGTIFAVIMIMAGGFRWIMAAGDQGSIGKAKEMIGNAFIGLIILLGSYMLLFTINPELINLKPIRLVKPNTVVFGNWCDDILKNPEYSGKVRIQDPTVDDSNHKCGDTGEVVPIQAGVTLPVKNCYWKECVADNQICTLQSDKTTKCDTCEQVTAESLKAMGLPLTSESCSKYKTADNTLNGNNLKYLCLFDSNIVTQSKCVEQKVDCTKVKSCEDYPNLYVVSSSVGYDLSVGLTLANQTLLDYCKKNVCNVSGTCIPRMTPTLSCKTEK